jgi:hypothetical protein
MSSKKKFDPTDTKEIADELDQSAFFRQQSSPPPTTATAPISANAELQKSVNLQKQKSAIAENQRALQRKSYDKTSYRLCPEAFDAIENTKRLLKRKFGIKATFEDIAEIALILINEDLEAKGEECELVKRLSAILQMQK